MRQLASYALHAQLGVASGSVEVATIVRTVDDWLGSKGTLDAGGDQLVFHDGRFASLTRSTTESSLGRITEAVLTEPTGNGWFRTSVSIAEFTGSLDVAVSLAAASDSLNPLSLDVHCPRLIRTLLALPAVWTYGATRLSSSPTNFTADAGGDAFTAIAWDPSRSVPIVAVSDEYGAVLFPEIVEAMANDLAGLALVARLDPGASWRITRRKGKEWSCYGGAIRLYWPQIKEGANHGDHPLWTARRLLTGVADTETAAGRIRSQLRRRILGQSAFAVTEAPIFAAIRRAARTEELTALQAKANADTDYRALAEAYSGEMDKLQEELERAEAEKVALREQVQELQLALRWKDQEANSVEPDLETPPSTVEEAVLTAMDTFDKYLVFGNSVDTGSSVRLFW